MPAFTFEKIAPPVHAEAEHASAPTEPRRNAIIRLLDRLTAARLAHSESSARRIQRLRHKYRKQRL
jgi:hypothetical protein